jgi:hypothetical protein
LRVARCDLRVSEENRRHETARSPAKKQPNESKKRISNIRQGISNVQGGYRRCSAIATKIEKNSKHQAPKNKHISNYNDQIYLLASWKTGMLLNYLPGPAFQRHSLKPPSIVLFEILNLVIGICLKFAI